MSDSDLKAALAQVNEGKANPVADFTKVNEPPTPNSNPPDIETPTSDSNQLPPSTKDSPSTVTSKTPEERLAEFNKTEEKKKHNPSAPKHEGDKSLDSNKNKELDSRTANLVDEAHKRNLEFKSAPVHTSPLINKRALIADVLRNNGMDSMQQQKALADILKILGDSF